MSLPSYCSKYKLLTLDKRNAGNTLTLISLITRPRGFGGTAAEEQRRHHIQITK